MGQDLNKLTTNLKDSIVIHLLEKGDVPYISTRGKFYTASQLAAEVQEETKFGINLLESLLGLTLDLVHRGKRTIQIDET